MKDRKKATFVYEGLGFPVLLIDVPMKKVFGEWAIDVGLNRLQLAALHLLLRKRAALTGDEIRFIRKFLEMSTTEFGDTFGVSHVAVVKWENEQMRMNPGMEVYIRLHMWNHLRLKDKEFRKFYNEMDIHCLGESPKKKAPPLSIDRKALNAVS